MNVKDMTSDHCTYFLVNTLFAKEPNMVGVVNCLIIARQATLSLMLNS